jgi:hypothetical protein
MNDSKFRFNYRRVTIDLRGGSSVTVEKCWLNPQELYRETGEVSETAFRRLVNRWNLSSARDGLDIYYLYTWEP